MMSKKIGTFLIVAMFLLQAQSATVYAQTQPNQDELIERALVELQHLRRAKVLDAARIAALNELVKKLEEQIAAEQAVSDQLRLANVERQRASRLEQERWSQVELIIKELKERLATVERQRDTARGRLWKVGAACVALGAAVTAALMKQ